MLSGHTHKRAVETEDGTTLLVQGSTGGAGLRALRGEDATPVTLSVLYLDREDQRLQAYDDITLGGVGVSDARISRTVVVEQDEAGPSRSPSTSQSPSPSPSPDPHLDDDPALGAEPARPSPRRVDQNGVVHEQRTGTGTRTGVGTRVSGHSSCHSGLFA